MLAERVTLAFEQGLRVSAFTQDINPILMRQGVSGRRFASGANARADQESVLAALCRFALTMHNETLGGDDVALGDTAELADLIERNRMWSPAIAGIARAGVPVPSDFVQRAQRIRSRTMLANTRAMTLARDIFPALQSRGIAAVAFKGPFHQHRLHGDYFYRTSHDLDLLVPRRQFAAALTAIEALGLEPRQGTSAWWRHSLGEVHLVSPGGGTVDLHHRLQQPGCPAPRKLEDFFTQSEVHVLGGVAIAVPAPEQALLIDALNFCKELFHRKRAVRYAFDFAAGALRLPEASHAAFEAQVHRQGLAGPVGFATAASEALFGIRLPLPEGCRASSRWTTQEMIRPLVLAPDAPGLEWPRRRELLWAFCGGGGSKSSIAFAGQACRIALDEILRRHAVQS